MWEYKSKTTIKFLFIYPNVYNLTIFESDSVTKTKKQKYRKIGNIICVCGHVADEHRFLISSCPTVCLAEVENIDKSKHYCKCERFTPKNKADIDFELDYPAQTVATICPPKDIIIYNKNGSVYLCYKANERVSISLYGDMKRWNRLREMTFKKFGRKCRYCDSTQDLRIHHIISIKENPFLAVDPDNLEPVCVSCHKRIHPNINFLR
jgi:hypothetical protein